LLQDRNAVHGRSFVRGKPICPESVTHDCTDDVPGGTPARAVVYQSGPDLALLIQEITPVAEPLRCMPPDAFVTGWAVSTGPVKCVACDLDGRTLAEVRLPTDLWTAGGVSELNLLQLEGQARASTRAIAARLRDLGRLDKWVAGGISATHHTAGRLDRDRVQV